MTQEEHLKRITTLSEELASLANQLAAVIEEKRVAHSRLATVDAKEIEIRNKLERVKDSLLKMVGDIK